MKRWRFISNIFKLRLACTRDLNDDYKKGEEQGKRLDLFEHA